MIRLLSSCFPCPNTDETEPFIQKSPVKTNTSCDEWVVVSPPQLDLEMGFGSKSGKKE